MVKIISIVGVSMAAAITHDNSSPVRRGNRHSASIGIDGTIEDYPAAPQRPSSGMVVDSFGGILGGASSFLETSEGSAAQRERGNLDKIAFELEQYANGKKELPDSIKGFIEAIKTHALDIRQKLIDESAAQASDLDTVFGNIKDCDDTLTASLVPIDGDGATSANSHAKLAKDALCKCRKEQAMANADAQGCNDELACRDTVMASDLAAKTTFIADKTETDAGMCDTSDAWQTMAGGDDGTKALAWFAKERESWDRHWVAKTTKLQGLITAYNTARATRDALWSGTTPYEGKGCEALRATKTAKDQECLTIHSHATMNQCYYLSQKSEKCDEYTQCRTHSEAAWNVAVQRETKNSQDRKDGWVAAAKVACLASSFVENAAGKLEVSGTVTATCSSHSCDTECIAALDLSVSLARVPGPRSACVAPPAPCATGGWEGSCDSTETANWGSHTPPYLIGARTAPACSGTPLAAELASEQVTIACQACSASSTPTAPHAYPAAATPIRLPPLHPTAHPTAPHAYPVQSSAVTVF